ncbi:MAG: DNA repair protein RecO [Candidatus Pacebacteria bacterium]|jgi:DNA repair protein RecO (recombination protein O)|nr:DNA repair protein RecO [Candidatus Paceibacterota bacterium]
MSHHIYHTEGFVLGSVGVKEADKYITIFTRELGVVSAIAQGIRKGSSKLRYALQDFSYARADLVRGVHVWRITSAQPSTDLVALTADPTKYRTYVKILSMIRRLYSGEAPDEELFDDLKESLLFLSRDTVANTEMVAGFELTLLVRILHKLGHLRAFPGREEYVSQAINPSMCQSAYNAKAVLIQEINTAIRESQL